MPIGWTSPRPLLTLSSLDVQRAGFDRQEVFDEDALDGRLAVLRIDVKTRRQAVHDNAEKRGQRARLDRFGSLRQEGFGNVRVVSSAAVQEIGDRVALRRILRIISRRRPEEVADLVSPQRRAMESLKLRPCRCLRILPDPLGLPIAPVVFRPVSLAGPERNDHRKTCPR